MTPPPAALIEAMASAIQYEAAPELIVADILSAAHRAGFCLVAKEDLRVAANITETVGACDEDRGYKEDAEYNRALVARLRQAAGEGTT